MATAKRGLSEKTLRGVCILCITSGANCDSLRRMNADRAAMLDDIAALKEVLAAERAKTLEIAAELAVARAKAAEDSALIAHQNPRIAKLERHIYGQSV